MYRLFRALDLLKHGSLLLYPVSMCIVSHSHLFLHYLTAVSLCEFKNICAGVHSIGFQMIIYIKIVYSVKVNSSQFR